MGMQNRIPNSLPQAINVKLRLQNMTFFSCDKRSYWSENDKTLAMHLKNRKQLNYIFYHRRVMTFLIFRDQRVKNNYNECK